MLAQAQQAFLIKALRSNMKDATKAKLAMQAALFYSVSYEAAKESQLFEKDWLSYLQAKNAYCKGMAYFYQSHEANTKGKYGEQVGWLLASQDNLKKAVDSQLVKHLSNTLVSEIKDFSATVQVAAQRAIKDNDMIYMEKVPKENELTVIEPARMVNPTMPPSLLDLSATYGKPLFQNLVPFKAHVAASAYDAKKDKLVKDLIDKLNEATAISQSTLSSLHLPGSIQALEQPVGLPANILSKSEQIRQSGGTRGLISQFDRLMQKSNQARGMLKQGLDILDQEARQDEFQRQQFRERWARPSSNKLTTFLYEKARVYREKIDVADRSNQTVKTKLDGTLKMIEHLCLSKSELEQSIPSSTIQATLFAKDPNLKQLKMHLDSLNSNLKKRSDIISKLKQMSKNDDIGTAIMQACTTSKEFDQNAVIERQLLPYMQEATIINNLISEQEGLLEQITKTNHIFMNSNETIKLTQNRENALSNLEQGYKAWTDISNNISEGMSFYNELEALLIKFVDQCRDFASNRSREEKDIIASLSGQFSQFQLSSQYQSAPQLPPPIQPPIHGQSMGYPSIENRNQGTMNQPPVNGYEYNSTFYQKE